VFSTFFHFPIPVSICLVPVEAVKYWKDVRFASDMYVVALRMLRSYPR
jgi:hypothetical protein